MISIYTSEALAAALGRGLDEGDGPAVASALRLLAAHGKWLDRFPFQACCDVTDGGGEPPVARVRWNAVGALLTAEEPERSIIGSPTSWVVLRIAHLLATDALGLSHLDHVNTGLVIEAVAGATGRTTLTVIAEEAGNTL